MSERNRSQNYNVWLRARVAELEAEIERLRSYTDEDVERVAEAIYSALEDSYSIARETTEAPTKAELADAARRALDACLQGSA